MALIDLFCHQIGPRHRIDLHFVDVYHLSLGVYYHFKFLWRLGQPCHIVLYGFRTLQHIGLLCALHVCVHCIGTHKPACGWNIGQRVDRRQGVGVKHAVCVEYRRYKIVVRYGCHGDIPYRCHCGRIRQQ